MADRKKVKTRMQKPKANKPHVAKEKTTAYRTARPSLTRVEAKALAEFRSRLKEVLSHGELKSLILYGSKARGDAHPWSDVDLLIVYDATRGDKEDAIRDIRDDIMIQVYERDPNATLAIEPLVKTQQEIEQAAAHGTPLLQNIAREGIVLEGESIMPGEIDRQRWTRIHIEDAKRTLQSARLLLSHGDIRSAISMAYFIYLDAARAALLAKGIAPKSHSGTNTLFGKHFIKTGLLPKKFGPHCGHLEKDRLEATYTKQKDFTQDDAERALAIAEELVTTVEQLLPTWLEEKS